MSVLSNDQRFVAVVLVALASGAWLIAGTTAQTFTTDDRNAIQKFVDILINFLDAETDPSNSTTTESPLNATTTDPLESTTLDGNSTTPNDVDSTTAANATSPSSTETSESTTNATSESTTSASNCIGQINGLPRRICFKRVCYKFAEDRGFIV